MKRIRLLLTAIVFASKGFLFFLTIKMYSFKDPTKVHILSGEGEFGNLTVFGVFAFDHSALILKDFFTDAIEPTGKPEEL